MAISGHTTDIGVKLAARSNSIARNRGVNTATFQSLLAREQLLAAIGRVTEPGTVALKGSALVLLDDAISGWVRPSSDLDLQVQARDVTDLREILDRAAAEVASVGIRIEFGKRRPLWKPDGSTGGEKVAVMAFLGRTRVAFEIDCWVGGQRTPGMRFRAVGSVLPGLPGLRMLAYPFEAMIADKLHAIAQFGSENTRIKDFYDLWHLGRHEIDRRLLAECVEVVFANNARPVPSVPVMLPGLSAAFAAANEAAWTTMLERAERVEHAPREFWIAVRAARTMAGIAFAAAAQLAEESREMEEAPTPRPLAMA